MNISKYLTTVIIPCFNEEDHIEKTLKIVLNSEVSEVIIVDDGSSDKTIEIASQFPVKILKHKTNEGKGKAIKTGVQESSFENLIFLDADLYGITSENLNYLSKELLHYDFIKTSFKRSSSYLGDGRVTKFCAIPLLRQFAPLLAEKYPQPLSGQIGIKKSKFKEMDLPNGWGIDIAILLRSRNLKSMNYEIGPIVNSPSSDDVLEKMANEIAKEICDWWKNEQLVD